MTPRRRCRKHVTQIHHSVLGTHGFGSMFGQQTSGFIFDLSTRICSTCWQTRIFGSLRLNYSLHHKWHCDMIEEVVGLQSRDTWSSKIVLLCQQWQPCLFVTTVQGRNIQTWRTSPWQGIRGNISFSTPSICRCSPVWGSDTEVKVYFGCGCFWHVQHEFVSLGCQGGEIWDRCGSNRKHHGRW